MLYLVFGILCRKPLLDMPVDDSDSQWPPGTVRIELLKDGGKTDIILQPRPTTSPNDPLNWPRWRKYLNFCLANFYATMVMVNINATTPTWGPMGTELSFSDATLNNTYAIGCATLAVGASMLIPFALKYGLRPVYVISSVGQFCVMIWAAKTQIAGDWWGVNALQCWLGALAEVLVQMTVSDVFFVHQRGRANSIYVWLANVGGTLGPVIAGFITDDMGWRWVWWLLVLFFGVQFLLMIFGFEESRFTSEEIIEGRRVSVVDEKSEPVIIAGDTKKHSTPAKDNSIAPNPHNAEVSAYSNSSIQQRQLSVAHVDKSILRKTYLQRLQVFSPSPGSPSDFLRHSWQPFIILVTIPGVAYCSLVYAVLLGWNTTQSAALSTYMIDPPYNFSATAIGLMNLAPFIGNSLGSLICGPVSDWLVLKLAKGNHGIYEPGKLSMRKVSHSVRRLMLGLEMRFWVFLPFIPFQVAGAWWFGYALQLGQAWMAVAVAWAMANFGQAPISAIALTYLTDSYNEVCISYTPVHTVYRK